MTKPMIYITRGNLPEDFEDKHHRWYAAKHSTDVLGVGFWSARGYDSLSSPKMLNLYEVPSLDLFSTDQYRAMRKNDPFVAEAVGNLADFSAAVYSQIVVVTNDGTELASPPTTRGPVVIVHRFNSGAEDSVIEQQFRDVVVSEHVGIDSVRTVRLLKQGDKHPLFEQQEPTWAIIVEWKSLAALKTFNGEKRLDAARNGFASDSYPAGFNVATKRYALVREDVFPALA